MLTGPELGAAIEEAMRLKGVSRSETARHFGIRPESTYDWTKYGRVAKKHLPNLFAYFADVVGPEHWGMPSQPARLDTAKLASLIETVEAAAKNAERVPLKAPITARMKARLIVNLYADSGSKLPTAKAVAAELARIMKAEEVTD